ncbi:MAG: phosphopantetheine adenylyltransferase [Chloroflexota bacterium]
MRVTITILLLIVSVIHLLPLIGVLGEKQLASLYDLPFEEPNLAILMRHRAVLFGLLGVFFLYAAFWPVMQPLAFIAGFVSVVSFLGLAWQVGGYNKAIRKVVIADVIALICLLGATGLYLLL